MNENTKLALKQFADCVSFLAQGTVRMIGLETAKEVLDAVDNLKKCLDKDETLP